MVKISVIIPCYNQEEFLAEALNSLTGSYNDFEVIVVNDGSTNYGAKDKIKAICSKYYNVKLINQTNQGICAARNNAINEASGEYILPLDADDITNNSFLEKGAKILDCNPNIGIVYCKAEFFGEKTGKWKLGKPSMLNMLSQNRIFNSAMYRKSDFEKVGGYKLYMNYGNEDWDFWLSIMELGLKPFIIDEVLFKYRKLPNSRSNNALEFKNYVNIRKNIVLNHKKLDIKSNVPAA